ncbi:MAG: GNAT family N-acetyltransferase [Coriobacteriales bacterium]|nr:GNAT family N-acetyltransferase [Coriobacteriales bacterium]
MSQVVITTKRLALRAWTLEDADALVALVSDPDVSRFIHRGTPISLHQAIDFITRQMRTQKERGWCRWALEPHTMPGMLIGWCGPGCTFAPQVELGWTLRRDQWGRGLATEAAVAALAYLFGVAGFPTMISAIDPSNAASVRVAEKLGMHLDGDLRLDGLTLARYRADNPLVDPPAHPGMATDCVGEPAGSSLAGEAAD